MATHARIIANEKEIIATTKIIADGIDEYRAERVYMQSATHGYPENHDVWGTYRLNLLALRRTIDSALDVFAAEFGSPSE